MTFATIEQTEKHSQTSDRYSFIPTSRVLSVLESEGFTPTRIMEAGTRKPENRGFQKHIVRLRQTGLSVSVGGDEFPEIVLINSHLGSSAFELRLGVFRLVCSNGLVTGDTFASYKIRHVGYTDEAVRQSLESIINITPTVMSKVSDFKQIELNRDESMAYAESVAELLNESSESAVLNPATLIRAWRQADKAPTLWNTYNVAQEKVMKGDYQVVTASAQRRKAKVVKSVDRNIALNKALWSLTEKMAELKS